MIKFLATASLGFLTLYGARELLGITNNNLLHYYAYLAESFMNGRLDLPAQIPSTYDLSIFNGRIYAYWPPLPALMMMPCIHWLGVATFPQQVFTIAWASINCGFIWLILRNLAHWGAQENESERRRPDWFLMVLAVLTGIGSPMGYLALRANHWEAGQVLSSVPLFAAIATLSHSLHAPDKDDEKLYWLAACLMALAVLGRTHQILAGVLIPTFWWVKHRPAQPWRSKTIWWSTVPFTCVILFTLWYNYARFGSVFETGINYQRAATRYLGDYNKYGPINWHYIPHNFYTNFLRPPFMANRDGYDFFEGFSIFIASPVFLWIFRRGIQRNARYYYCAFAGTSLILVCFLMLFFGTGWAQYGARYFLDVTPFWIALIGLQLGTMDPRARTLLMIAALISTASSIYGGILTNRL